MELHAIASLVLLLAACQAPAASVAPLAASRTVPVAYSASIGPGSGHVSTPEKSQPAAAAPFERSAVTAQDHQDHIEIRCRYLSIAPGNERTLFAGGSSATLGHVMTLTALQAAIDEWEAKGLAVRGGDSRMSIVDGQATTISVGREAAYVQAFDIQSTDATLIGDPRIAQLHSGLTLDVRAKSAPGNAGIGLDMTLASAALISPLTSTDVRLPGTSTAVCVQIPIVFDQKLSTTAELASDEVLVLDGLWADHDDRWILACVSVRRGTSAVAAR